MSISPESQAQIKALIDSVDGPLQAIEMLRTQAKTQEERRRKVAGKRWLQNHNYFKDGVLIISNEEIAKADKKHHKIINQGAL